MIIGSEKKERLTFGQKLSDKIASFGGSWKFIILFSLMMATWILLNTLILKNPFDPYPFILLNLGLSCLASLQAPIIMMSQNRQETKDRKRSEEDLKIDKKSETEIRLLLKRVEKLQKSIDKLNQK